MYMPMLTIFFFVLFIFLNDTSASSILPLVPNPTNATSATCAACLSSTPGGVYLCPETYFVSSAYSVGCTWFPPSDHCYSFAEPKDVMKSIAPDYGGYCKVYVDNQCKGDTMQIMRDNKTHE
jgi:hypothetical protein